jgi:hypothetical protein
MNLPLECGVTVQRQRTVSCHTMPSHGNPAPDFPCIERGVSAARAAHFIIRKVHAGLFLLRPLF